MSFFTIYLSNIPIDLKENEPILSWNQGRTGGHVGDAIAS